MANKAAVDAIIVVFGPWIVVGQGGVVEYLYERPVAMESPDTAFQIQMYNCYNLSINGNYCICKQKRINENIDFNYSNR